MNIKVDLDADDWMEYHKHHLLNNKQFLKTKMLITYVVPLVFGVFLYYKFQADELRIENALMVILMSVLWVSFYPKRLVSKALTRARTSVDKEEHGASLGSHEINFNDQGIHHKHKNADKCFEWDSVDQVEETDSIIILKVSSASPIIIPKSKLESMQISELRQILKEKQR